MRWSMEMVGKLFSGRMSTPAFMENCLHEVERREEMGDSLRPPPKTTSKPTDLWMQGPPKVLPGYGS